MKTTLMTAALLFANWAFANTFQQGGKYEVIITNLTKGQPMHHPLLILHNRNFSLFKVGRSASPGLELLAKDGSHRLLKRELRRRSVSRILEADQVLHPGKSVRFVFSTRSRYLSLASMLASTNDGFLGGTQIDLRIPKGKEVHHQITVYDAGAEANNESCRNVPGPPCSAHYSDTRDSEGFVHVHPGVFGIGDLDVLKAAFSSTGAAMMRIYRLR